MSFWLAQWILKRQDEKFLKALIDTRAQVDEIADAQIRKVLFDMRLGVAVAPYKEAMNRFLYIFKLVWEVARGRYRKPRSQDDSDPNASPGGGAGTFGQPVAQYTGFSGPGGAISPATGPGGLNVSSPRPNPSSFFEDAGIVAGEVVAYRGWRMRDGLLTSMFQSEAIWTPGSIMEGDAAGGDGVHAFKSVVLLAQYGSSYSGDVVVTGTVWLWGDVYEHTRGYRASKAAIRSIDDSHEYDAKVLRKKYGLNKRPRKSLPKPEA
jgi:hypothetical protein